MPVGWIVVSADAASQPVPCRPGVSQLASSKTLPSTVANCRVSVSGKLAPRWTWATASSLAFAYTTTAAVVQTCVGCGVGEGVGDGTGEAVGDGVGDGPSAFVDVAGPAGVDDEDARGPDPPPQPTSTHAGGTRANERIATLRHLWTSQPRLD